MPPTSCCNSFFDKGLEILKQYQRLNYQLPQTIYTPESQLRYPLKLLQQMWRDLLAARELAWRLMVRDISVQYRQSFLGIAWAFLPPIVLAASFTLANEAKVINIGLEAALGRWVTFLDDDDRLLPQMAEISLKALSQ